MELLHSKVIGKGKPLVILHGFMGTGDNWKTLGNQFAADGFQVHLLDQRNHGKSFHSEEWDYKVMAADLLYYCAQHHLDTIYLMGHSMGGKTAMEFATSYPERVTKLIVADIGPKEYPSHHQDILKALSLLDFTVLKSRGQADRVLGDLIKDAGTRQFLLKNLYWRAKGLLGLRVNLAVVSAKIEEVGKALGATLTYHGDTLFVRGAKSGYIEEADEWGIKNQFPKSQLKTVSNAGHWLHAENPEEYYDIVMNFL